MVDSLYTKDVEDKIFTMSIEETEGKSYQHGFHLGTGEELARKLVEEKFRSYVLSKQPIVTIALKRGGRLFDTFYGDRWHSQLGE